MSVEKLVIDKLNEIYSNAEEICKTYDTTVIPFNLINEIVVRYKVSPVVINKDSKTGIFFTRYNTMLDSLLLTCDQTCSKMEGTKIPLSTFKSYIGIVKDSFMEGVKTA